MILLTDYPEFLLQVSYRTASYTYDKQLFWVYNDIFKVDSRQQR